MSRIFEFKSKHSSGGTMEIRNETSDNADLYFYGDIVSDWWGAWQEEDQYPDAIRDFLNGVKGKDLDVYINSGGGSVFAGLAIYNMLKRHSGRKTVYVDGIAASIASVIALAGDRVVIPSNAFLMIHKPFQFLVGGYNSNELIKISKDLDDIERGIINIYKENLKADIDIAEIEEMVSEETWLNGEEASRYFDIEVVSENSAVACTTEFTFANAPESVQINRAVGRGTKAKFNHDNKSDKSDDFREKLRYKNKSIGNYIYTQKEMD